MIALAIDIGLTGALAAVDSYGTARVVDLPTLPDGKTRRLDGRALIVATWRDDGGADHRAVARAAQLAGVVTGAAIHNALEVAGMLPEGPENEPEEGGAMNAQMAQMLAG